MAGDFGNAAVRQTRPGGPLIRYAQKNRRFAYAAKKGFSLTRGLLRQIGVSRDKANLETEWPANLLQGRKRRICLSSFNLSDLSFLQKKHSGKFRLRHPQTFADFY